MLTLLGATANSQLIKHHSYRSAQATFCLQGDVKKLVDDVGAFKPSLFVAVPRVLDRMKSGIEAKVARSGPIASTIFKLAVWYKRIWVKLGFLNNVSFLRDLAAVTLLPWAAGDCLCARSGVGVLGSRQPSWRI